MEMIRHQNRCENAPFPKFRSSIPELIESRLICQDLFAIINADRNEINYRLFPTQPNGNAWRVAILEFGRRSARPTTFFSRQTELPIDDKRIACRNDLTVGQAHRLPSHCSKIRSGWSHNH
jgi:hypothetical protein